MGYHSRVVTEVKVWLHPALVIMSVIGWEVVSIGA